MTRFTEGTMIIGKEIELTEDEVLRLEIELIELERMLYTNKLDYDSSRNLIEVYEIMLEFIDQQTLKYRTNK